MRVSVSIASALAALSTTAVANYQDYKECPGHLAPVTQFYLYGNEDCADKGPGKQLGNVRDLFAVKIALKSVLLQYIIRLHHNPSKRVASF